MTAREVGTKPSRITTMKHLLNDAQSTMQAMECQMDEY